MTDRDALLALHGEVDAAVAQLEGTHAGRLACGPGCADCCADDLTVFEVEAARIRQRHGDLLRFGAPAPRGACAFLDGDRRCRIHADRPYVCRTQGLPLRWFEEAEDAQGEVDVVESRDICPLNARAVPPEAQSEEACWLLGPMEERLVQLQETAQGGDATAPLRRVALRDLFQRRAPDPEPIRARRLPVV